MLILGKGGLPLWSCRFAVKMPSGQPQFTAPSWAVELDSVLFVDLIQTQIPGGQWAPLVDSYLQVTLDCVAVHPSPHSSS